MSLIKQIHNAIRNGKIVEPFTFSQFEAWISEESICKDDGTKYAKKSIDSILSNSNKKNRPTSNKNIKTLLSRINSFKKSEYWFE